MRIIVGSLVQESNTFSPRGSSLADFRGGCLLFGEQSLAEFAGKGTEVSGFIAAAEQEQVTLIPTMTAWASSAGPLARPDFDWLVDRFLDAVRAAGPADGILLALHGAWVADGESDADGHLLARLRQLVGQDTPVAVTHDIHANATRRVAEAADILVGFQTYPHIDMFETGQRAARLLFHAARGEIRPKLTFRKVPMIVPPENCQTTDGPMAEILALARATERAPGILAASVFPVQPWLDLPELGLSSVIVSDSIIIGRETDLVGHKVARKAADDLARLAWSKRRAFAVELVAPDKAVSTALAAEHGPTLLVDSADSTSSGATGDSTAILHALLDSPWASYPERTVLLTMVDAEAARAAVAAGHGATLELKLGGKLDPRRHRPAEVRGLVERVTDGRFTFSAGVGSGLVAEMGPAAVLRVGAIRIVLMENAVPCYDPALYRSVGLEPGQSDAVVVKSPTNFRWTYRDIGRQVIYVDAPGASTPRLASLQYRQAPRPLFPLEDFDWQLGSEQVSPE